MTSFTFTASDQTPLAAYKWEAASQPKALIHIIHGLAEHAARYERTAKSLNAHGYTVYASDLRGHGQTARSQEELGCWTEEEGWERVVLDLLEMLEAEAQAHPALPLILLFISSSGSCAGPSRTLPVGPTRQKSVPQHAYFRQIQSALCACRYAL
jgi:alpha-beta hydrolase superfamily lysophospholipase